MWSRQKLFIDGKWDAPGSEERLDVRSPHDARLVGQAPAGTAADIDRAVMAASAALPRWSDTDVDERAAVLERMADHLQSCSAALASLIVDEVGTPIKLTQRAQVALPIFNLRRHAEHARRCRLMRPLGHSLLKREPAGVVAAITPWNYPLHQAVLKVAGALAAGCTVVLKPSELTPLNAYALADAAEAAGLPPGVLNVVTGQPALLGDALTRHPLVDRISFTGSTVTGRRVAESAAQSIKRVSLELGGKGAAVLLDDAILERAVGSVVRSCTQNSGQTCSALTRLLVPRELMFEAQRIAIQAANGVVVGNPSDTGTQMGPLISDRQLERVRGWIARGISDGATLLCGGAEPVPGLPELGHYIRPTVFAQLDPRAPLAREEVFGPVLCMIGYDTEDEAVAIANSTPYGLSAGVWSADTDRALRLAHRLRAGQVDINDAAFNPDAPFGGFKQSGYGREAGEIGIEEYLEYKSIQLPAQRAAVAL